MRFATAAAIVIIGLLGSVSGAVEPPPARLRQTTYQVSSFGVFGMTDLLVTANGAVYIAGPVTEGPFISRIDPNGNHSWTIIETNAPLLAGFQGSLAVDTDDNVYRIYTDFTNTFEEVVLIKYSSAGVRLHETRPVSPNPGASISASGLVYDRGTLYATMNFTDADFRTAVLVAQFNLNLGEVKRDVYRAPEGNGLNGAHVVGHTHVAPSGRVNVAASDQGPPATAVLLRYDSGLMNRVEDRLPGFLGGTQTDPVGGMFGSFLPASGPPAPGPPLPGPPLPGPPSPLIPVTMQVSPSFGPQRPSCTLLGVGPQSETYCRRSSREVQKVDASGADVWSPLLTTDAEKDPASLSRVSSTSVYLAGGFTISGQRYVYLDRYGQGSANASLEISTAGSQIGTPMLPADIPLEVLLTSQAVPANGATVQFRISGFPPQATGYALSISSFTEPLPVVFSTYTSAVTGEDGRARAWFLFGNRVGSYTVTASCDGCMPSSGTFTLTAMLTARVVPSTHTIRPRPRIGLSSENMLTLRVDLSGPRADGSTRPVANYPVVLVGTTAALSGGHNHHGGRPIGTLAGVGLTIATTPATASGRTNVAGQLFAIYTSTYFGGIETFVARSTIDPEAVFGSTTIAVDVGGLVLLPATTFYTKVGGTAFHRGPPFSPSTDENHFGSFDFVAKTTTSLAQFNLAYPARTVSVNDMSLPRGGQFDIGPTGSCQTGTPRRPCRFWEPPHSYHRLGRAADLDLDIASGLDRMENTDEEKRLRTILNRQGIMVHHEGDHWHIFLSGDGPQ